MYLIPSPWVEQWQYLVNFYIHLTSRIVPGPNSSCYFGPFILLPGALLIPPHVLSHKKLALTFLPVIFGCQIHAWSTKGIDVISINLTLWAFVLLLLRDPRRTHRRVWVSSTRKANGNPASTDDSKEDAETTLAEPYPKDIMKRVSWVLTLLVSLRLTGWRIGDPSFDRTQPPQSLSRKAFLSVALKTVLTGYIILDTTSWYVQTDAYFHTSRMAVDATCSTPTSKMPWLLLVLRTMPARLLRVSVLAAQIYAMVTSMFFLPTLPALGLNAIGVLPVDWSPHTWPLFFGEFSAVEMGGLRGLWGSWWHCMNRQNTATPGRSLAQALGIPTKSKIGYALLTISAFFFSGVMHMGMIPPEPQSEHYSALELKLYVAAFFWVQIPAFATEIAVVTVLARFAPHVAEMRVSKMMTLVWVAAWLSLTLPLLTVPFREIGYWHYYAIPFSVLQRLNGERWTTWPALASFIDHKLYSS